ncbi:helix-turn-helix transcriptional regulator [Mesorhizobium sophorae]|uniref:helix-turn-helix transcriptional regulator n=1 Tax=Mesorhizobium sophorae TaxID=1300294 RepID=UPI000BA3DAE2|nr:hypothetical protein [Mesorhizobium sophorae]
MDTNFEAYSIPEFCVAHRISRATFYNLIKAGVGPRTMHVGGRVLVSKEAGAEWRRAREAASTTEAA